MGCWNGHGSLLPRWRGAGPIQWCLLEGDSQTGVGVMAMEEGLDTGPVLLESSLPIGLLDNAHHLGESLADLTGSLLVQAMPLIEGAGPGSQAERWARLGLKSQSEQGMTYARQLVKDDFLLEWSQKKKLNIKYETCEEIQVNKSIVFRCHVWLGEEKIANATETSKKKAEEKAAQRAFYILNKKENILGNPKTL
jgi:methionyl-tRNA formyltransferase